MALANLRSRLQAQYGDPASLRLLSARAGPAPKRCWNCRICAPPAPPMQVAA